MYLAWLIVLVKMDGECHQKTSGAMNDSIEKNLTHSKQKASLTETHDGKKWETKLFCGFPIKM